MIGMHVRAHDRTHTQPLFDTGIEHVLHMLSRRSRIDHDAFGRSGFGKHPRIRTRIGHG